MFLYYDYGNNILSLRKKFNTGELKYHNANNIPSNMIPNIIHAIVVPQPSNRNLTISTNPFIIQPNKPPPTNSRMTNTIKPMNASIFIYTTIAKTTNS